MLSLIVVLIGAAVMLGLWSAYRLISAVPKEDRSYFDRPPVGFRLVWPWIRFLVHYMTPIMSARWRLGAQSRLRRAGADYMVSPEQLFAAKCIAAALAALLALLCASAFHMTVAGATLLCVTLGLIGAVYPDIWLRETTQKRERQIFKSLPFFLDVITLSVEAGTNITGAFTQAVQRAPDGPLKSEFGRFLRDVRAGKSRAEALRALADRMQLESINSFVGSVIQAERMGGSLGQVLRAQADQRRSERFLRAEKQAMEAPVKLLGPLVAFIFPTTFMVLIFVLLYKAAEGGVVTSPTLLWALTWPAQR